MATDPIYPVVLARDASTTVEFTLESLRDFPEVLVYAWGRSGRVREICRRYPNVQFVNGDFLGSGRTRNRAASLAEGDWILALNADEYLSDALRADLEEVELPAPTTAYSIQRHNLFLGKDIRWGGWGNDWSVRIYNRLVHQFDDSLDQARIALAAETKTRRLHGALWCLAVTDIDQLLKRASRRSELGRHTEGRVLSPPLAVASASWAFSRSYFLELGLLEGWRGLLIALTGAIETLFRHMKRYTQVSEDAVDKLSGSPRLSK